jgi:hypothetical protein
MSLVTLVSAVLDGGERMLAFLLFLLIVWIVVGIIGFVVNGLFWLFIVACVLFVLTLLGGVFGRGRGSVRSPR